VPGLSFVQVSVRFGELAHFNMPPRRSQKTTAAEIPLPNSAKEVSFQVESKSLLRILHSSWC
jgi:hypothetical protein